jgi:hypothetical protein
LGAKYGRWIVPVAGLLLSLAVLAAAGLPYLPNNAGHLGPDYGFWLPNLLAGEFWHLNNPPLALPWFTPSECAGVPLQADPQGAYLSPPQFLAFLIPPLQALQVTFLAYGAAGFLGCYALARRFRCSRAASLLAGVIFALNGFYTARLLVGHLSFAPFMLLPAMALCLLGPNSGRANDALRALGLGALLAICVQSGMMVLVLPALLSLVLLAVLHELASGGGLRAPLRRLAAGGILSLALCAGKLAAVLALMHHLPRDLYPLPGFSNIFQSTWIALRCLFLWPAATMTEALENAALRLETHEFDYRVGPVPLVFLAALAWRAWQGRSGGPPAPVRTRLLWEALVLLLLIPLALNTHSNQWTRFLKHLPILRNSTSLVRWFAAYMLPAAITAGLALDRLWPTRTRQRLVWAAVGVGVTCGLVLIDNRAEYGAAGMGNYNPGPVQAAWRAATAAGRPPPILALAKPTNTAGEPDFTTNRGNALAQGQSPLFCYDPIFGYRLEQFVQGTLHPGPVTDTTRTATRIELNLKNPACYVFPGANQCAPGDTFTADQLADEAAFASYRQFDFHKPWWAHLADSVSELALLGTVLCGFSLLILRQVRRP